MNISFLNDKKASNLIIPQGLPNCHIPKILAVRRGVAKIGNPLPYLFEWDGMLGPIPMLGQNANGVGVINTAPEIDGVVRRIPLIMKIERERRERKDIWNFKQDKKFSLRLVFKI